MSAQQTTSFSATGRRKTAVARAELIPGKGSIEVNGHDSKHFFDGVLMHEALMAPLKVTDTADAYDISLKVKGGGKSGQAGAAAHAIARALVAADESLKPELKKGGFLTRDPRMKERKKPGQPGARKKYQFSKR
ncbi:30S ribosomal protein S9 [Kiritimatiella glycovorans]|uniref:Small ribosomal subunit protein uS9 n=1 Tax=Kiritimatiella glycovorans TaxID=1307763 RepID=A0A0G3EB40_9BACT|nr:30S ribosomal protein S9 [Kiritimatiella glycovorans]AKJ63716.1 30S ribosomal protein S9 [Kiritimatiella glycovorans]